VDWFRENVWFLVSVFGGALLSVFSIDTHSMKEALIRTVCGVFCALTFANPVIDWMKLDPTIYENGVAGLLAISGYSISKIFANISVEKILKVIKTLRGGK